MRAVGLTFLILFALSAGLAGARENKTGDSSASPSIKSIDLLAGRELTLPPSTGTGIWEALIPVRCTPAAAFPRLSLQTVAVLLRGEVLDPGAVTLRPDPGAGVQRLVLTVELSKLAAAGTYTVKVQATPADPSLAALPLLEFTLIHSTAELRATGPLHLQRTVVLPWLWSRWKPTAVTLNEWSGKSVLTTAQHEWTCELRGTGGLPAGRLQFTLPDRIPAGGQGNVCVKEVEPPSLGKSIGSLLVRSPQLATGVFEVSVEVMSRAWPGWLFCAIGAGIFAGYWVRTKLEDRRRLAQARVTAGERLQALTEAINKAADAPTRRELEGFRETLKRKLEESAVTPESIESAAKDAATKMESCLHTADEKRASLRSQLATTRAELGLPDGQPPRVVDVLREAEEKLAAAGAKLDFGDVTGAEKLLSPLRQSATTKLRELVAKWKNEIEPALDRCGAWPQTRLPAALEQVRADLAEAAKAEDLKTILPVTFRLDLHLRYDLLDAAIGSITTQAGDVNSNLRGVSDAALKPSLDQLDEILRGVPAARAAASLENLNPVTESVHKLHEAVSAALQAAIPPKGGSPGDAPSGLKEGKFLEALEDAMKKRAARITGVERALDHEGGIMPTMLRLTQWPEAVAPPRGRSSWELAIDKPPTTIPVRTPEGVASFAGEAKELKRIERTQTLIAGLLITVIGYLLYQSVFIGDLADFATAFFWGFSTDIGVARVRELASPLVSRVGRPAASQGAGS